MDNVACTQALTHTTSHKPHTHEVRWAGDPAPTLVRCDGQSVYDPTNGGWAEDRCPDPLCPCASKPGWGPYAAPVASNAHPMEVEA